MKKIPTQSNSHKVFYEKSRGLFEIALWMQNSKDGVSLQDIMDNVKVSKRTAIRIKDSLKEWFPQMKEIHGKYNTKRWNIPEGSLNYNSTPEKDVFQNKLKTLITLANMSGYPKVTPKQLVIAYYGKYTTENHNDRKTLAEIKEGLTKLSSVFNDHVDFNE